MRWPAIALAIVIGAAPSFAAAQYQCLTEDDVKQALGEQVRANAFVIDTSRIPDKPLCNGLTLAQMIQRMRDAAFPEERRQADAEQAALFAGDTLFEARAAPESEPAAEWHSAPRRLASVRRHAPARVRIPVKRKAAVRSSPARAATRSSHYPSCRAARAAGAAPIRRGQAGYGSHLDRDNDGVACE